MAPFSFHRHVRAAALIKKRFNSKAKHGKKGVKDMQKNFKRLKKEMEEIGEEQKHIREGQRQVEQKFEVIESECEELKRETRLIILQSAKTRIKLALMFRILKAREMGECHTAAHLTEMLRKKIDGMKEVMQERLKRLKTGMEDIKEEQKNIREEQRHVHENFEEVESECQKLRRDTKMTIQGFATTQLKLALMFGILKAKEDSDFATAASLTEFLQ